MARRAPRLQAPPVGLRARTSGVWMSWHKWVGACTLCACSPAMWCATQPAVSVHTMHQAPTHPLASTQAPACRAAAGPHHAVGRPADCVGLAAGAPPAPARGRSGGWRGTLVCMFLLCVSHPPKRLSRARALARQTPRAAHGPGPRADHRRTRARARRCAGTCACASRALRRAWPRAWPRRTRTWAARLRGPGGRQRRRGRAGRGRRARRRCARACTRQRRRWGRGWRLCCRCARARGAPLCYWPRAGIGPGSALCGGSLVGPEQQPGC